MPKFKTMLVNVTHVEESRVAVVNDGVLEAYEIETLNRAHIRGNIYNAVVENVHPALEAAFLKISPELNGFLPLDEVNFKLLPSRSDGRKGGRIGQHLHGGQKIMAQVVREPFAGKPPTVSTYFSLPGRYLVLMPGVDSAGVSRKIEDASQRDRLKKIVNELQPPEGFGLIVRTAGLGQTKAELQRDLRYLLRLWQSIQRASHATEFPSLVYREADLVIRTIRDHLTPDIGEVWIDSQETYDKALEFVRDVMPSRAKVLRLYTGSRPLFNKYNLEEQIETIYTRKVPLPSGGEIVIDGTEALTAIDVNSARSKRRTDMEENATTTNLEAAREVARQFRLRDLGGLIVIDFIDMAAPRNRKKVEETMRESLRGDKAKYDATRISKLGLMEIARQRLRGAKVGQMYNACPTCEGYGLIKNLEAAALAALRKLQSRSVRSDLGRVRLSVPSDVAVWMLNNKRDDLRQIERGHQLRVDINPKPELLRHQVEIETFAREKPEEPAARVVGERVPPLPPTAQEVEQSKPAAPEVTAEPAQPAAPAAPAAPRKRRRRRRKAEAPAAAPAQGAAGSTESGEPGQAGPSPAPEKVLEFPRSEPGGQAPPETDSAGEPASEDSEPASGRPRRRRRRRRRSRSGEAAPGGASESAPDGASNHAPSGASDGAPRAASNHAPSGASDGAPRGASDRAPSAAAEADGAAPAPPSPKQPPAGPDPIPSGVRSNELMPAAVGGSSGRGKQAGRRRSPSRKRSGTRRRGSGGDDGND